MPRTRLALIVCLLAGCHDDSRDPSSPTTGGPMLGSCLEDCPVGGPIVCSEGTVCITGGQCVLACEKDDPANTRRAGAQGGQAGDLPGARVRRLLADREKP